MSGFDTNRLERVREFLNTEVEADRLMGASFRSATVLDPIVVGRRRLDDAIACVEADTIFFGGVGHETNRRCRVDETG